MILPLALINRWPLDEYTQKYQTKAAALKASVTDALDIYKKILLLNDSFLADDGSKHTRGHNKATITSLRTREKWLDELCKYSDPVAILMANWPESRFEERSAWPDIRDTVDTPVLLRGIVAGKIMDEVIALGQDCYFIETGYFGNYPCVNNSSGRKLYHRIVRNRMQHHEVMDTPDDRWLDLVQRDPKLEYQGWRNPGSKILLVAPSEKPCQYYGLDRDKWVAQTTKRLSKLTDREIVVRHKVRRGDRNQNTIYEAFEDNVWAVVTYNSIAAAEAVAFGIPAFALAPTAAAPVVSADISCIETPFRPHDRFVYRWLSSLAYGQFHVDEMITGCAWRMVLENNDRKTVSP